DNSISYFFFQAEDGIRGFHVTGVQTCALPIFFRERGGNFWPASERAFDTTAALLPKERRAADGSGRETLRGSRAARRRFGRQTRSEERRVGQECILPGAPDLDESSEKWQAEVL